MRISFSLFYLLIGAVITLSSPPEWYVNQEFENESKFIVGLGHSLKKETALQLAQKQIAEQIEVKLNASFMMVRNEDRVIKNETIISEVDEKLPAVQIVKQKQVEETYYVMVQLEKEQLLKAIKRRRKEGLSQIKSKLSLIETLKKEGEAEQIWEQLNEIESLNDEIKKNNNIIDLFSKTKNNYRHESLPNIEKEKMNLRKQIKLTVVSGNKQIIEDQDKIKPIKLILSLGQVPMKLAKIRVYNEDQVKILRTNRHGEIYYKPSEIEEETKVKVVYKIGDVQKTETLTYKLKSESQIQKKIALSITQEGLRVTRLERQLKRQLQDMGYMIWDEANIEIKGELEVIKTQQLIGVLGQKWLVKVLLDLRIIKKRSDDEKVMQVKAKAVGETILEAGEKAIENIKLNKRRVKKKLIFN